jgi:hypothetical protein
MYRTVLLLRAVVEQGPTHTSYYGRGSASGYGIRAMHAQRAREGSNFKIEPLSRRGAVWIVSAHRAVPWHIMHIMVKRALRESGWFSRVVVTCHKTALRTHGKVFPSEKPWEKHKNVVEFYYSPAHMANSLCFYSFLGIEVFYQKISVYSQLKPRNRLALRVFVSEYSGKFEPLSKISLSILQVGKNPHASCGESARPKPSTT